MLCKKSQEKVAFNVSRDENEGWNPEMITVAERNLINVFLIGRKTD